MSVPKGLKAVLTTSPHDIVLLTALRTPITRAYKGGLRDSYPEQLLATVLRAAAAPLPDKTLVSDVSVGVVLSQLGGSKAARMALNHAGFDPAATALHTVNRACASSLQALTASAAALRVGDAEVVLAAGMESMTRNYGSRAIPTDLWPALREDPREDVRDCVMPMGLTSEIVADKYGVSRREQDAFAVESHRRAARARERGLFKAEIVPVETIFQDVDKDGTPVGEPRDIIVSEDDGIRPTASLEGLQKLKPAFSPTGASTAGNSSQVSDGASASLLMRRSTAVALGLAPQIQARFVTSSTVGCRPREMGIGPALAVPALLARTELDVGDVARWEVNEAFASQAVYCVRALGLQAAWEEGRVNGKGGAIALGHPLGATGLRLVSTLLGGMEAGEIGVVTLCVGTGMGMAGMFVRE